MWLSGGRGEWHSGCPVVLWWPEKPVRMTDLEQQRWHGPVAESGERAGVGKECCLAVYISPSMKANIFCLLVLKIKAEEEKWPISVVSVWIVPSFWNEGIKVKHPPDKWESSHYGLATGKQNPQNWKMWRMLIPSISLFQKNFFEFCKTKQLNEWIIIDFNKLSGKLLHKSGVSIF